MYGPKNKYQNTTMPFNNVDQKTAHVFATEKLIDPEYVVSLYFRM